MSDIAFSVIVNNNGIDDIVFKTIMLKGDKGNSVDHVEKTSTSGLVDTYTIYLTDGTAGGTFTVTNGNDINIDDTAVSYSKTWSSNKLSGMIKSIDDNVVSADKLWSSQKINSMLAQTGTIEDVAMASFSDGADDVPLSELTVDIEAWQEGSGEPSPSNERAIHGWNKCNINKANTNLWDEQWELSGNTVISKYPIKVVPNTTYYISCPVIADIDNVSESGQYISYITSKANGTFTTPADCNYIKFTIRSSYGTTYNNDISINYPATDHDYHAHDGGVDTIEFGQTIFGGKLNILTGLLHITHEIVDLGSLSWNKLNTTSPHWRFRAFIDGIKRSASSASIVDIKCPIFSAGSSTDTWIGTPYIIASANDADAIFVVDEDYSDADAFKTAMNGIMLVYELETPFDKDLTPTEVRTLLNANNIYADTGNIEKLVYFKTGSEAVARMIEAYMRAQPEE